MKMVTRSSILWGWLSVALVSVTPATLAQEPAQGSQDEGAAGQSAAAADENEAQRGWGLSVEAAAWFSQPVGSDFELASASNPNDPFGTSILAPTFGTDDRIRWRVGYHFKEDRGALIVTYWSQAEEDPYSAISPGNFVFGELLAYPVFAGVNDDGLADAVTAETASATRDLRVDFVKPAFRGERLSARWSVGLRSLDHNRSVEALYWALVPGLPALIEPTGSQRNDLRPSPDQAVIATRFSGRGPGAAVEFAYDLHKNVSLEFGLGAAILRGYADTSFRSTTYFYEVPVGETFAYVSPADYEEVFSDPDLIGFVQQRLLVSALNEPRKSTSALAVDVQVGFRWKAWRGLDLLGGFRASRYDGVAREIRLAAPVLSPNTVNLQGFEKRDVSIGHEGFYLGLAYIY